MDGTPFVVKLPAAVSADTCLVDAYHAGTSGGPQQTYSRPRDRHSIEIPTSKDSRTLRVVVWCRGYSVALVDVFSFRGSVTRRRPR